MNEISHYHPCTIRKFDFLVDPTSEKCPEGKCERSGDGTCKMYNDGSYHCLLGKVGTPCNYGSDQSSNRCFEYGGLQFYTWNGNGSSANLIFVVSKIFFQKLEMLTIISFIIVLLL